MSVLSNIYEVDINMDFSNRGSRPTAPSPQPAGQPASVNSHHSGKKSGKNNFVKYGLVTLLFSATILGILLIVAIAIKTTSRENQYVDETKYQAVFLNGGQVYFGKVKNLNNDYVRMRDIYYLQVNQQVQPNAAASTAAANDVSLVKLGCELHGPQDEMVINREQIVFWENLKTDGQVAKAVAEYQKNNPDGQNCTTQTNATGTNPQGSADTDTDN
jgi:hypothetical protein